MAVSDFVAYCNNRRYHKALGTVTPSDILDGLREEIMERQKEVQTQTIQRRRLYNQQLRELAESTRYVVEVGLRSRSIGYRIIYETAVLNKPAGRYPRPLP